MNIHFLSLIVLISMSLNAGTLESTKEVTKYNEFKNNAYIKNLQEKRDLSAENRKDIRELIRNYQAEKVYANLRR